MKIWVTRQSTGSLHSGGLERCEVWFVQPVYKYYDTRPVNVQANEVPWGINPMEGLGKWGWDFPNPKPGFCNYSVSFGKFFGYGSWDGKCNGHVDGLAEYVWAKLNEHYGNTEFPHGWYEYEKAGKCRQEDFLLEIELDVKMKTIEPCR